MKVKKQIEMILRQNQGWVNGGEIERLALGGGHKASTFSRTARTMAENGEIERQIVNKSVRYKWIKKFDIDDYNII